MVSNEKVVDLTIPMLQDMELAATRVADALAEVMDFAEDKRGEVSMALLEACINSFEHSKSEDRRVFITFRVDDEKMVIVLRDHGTGFNKANVSIPNIAEKLHKGARKRGWGLKLMESMMDSVEIISDETGTVVTMTKNK